MDGRRMFTAVMPTPDVVEELDALVEPRRTDTIRWTPVHQWHVTLLFTPQVPAHLVDDYREALAPATAELAPFRLAVRSGGAFPRVDAARHLIALLEDPDEGLPRLAAAHRRVARELGIGFEPRPYQPHLTLGRLNRARDMSVALGWLEGLATANWAVEHATLVDSVLEPRRGHAQHRVVEDFPLAG